MSGSSLSRLRASLRASSGFRTHACADVESFAPRPPYRLDPRSRAAGLRPARLPCRPAAAAQLPAEPLRGDAGTAAESRPGALQSVHAELAGQAGRLPRGRRPDPVRRHRPAHAQRVVGFAVPLLYGAGRTAARPAADRHHAGQGPAFQLHRPGRTLHREAVAAGQPAGTFLALQHQRPRRRHPL